MLFRSWALARKYSRILNIPSYFKILLFIEITTIFIVLIYILFPNQFFGSLIIYVAYQILFMFGGYSLRAETLFLRRVKVLSTLDSLKQIGYLAGLIVATFIYGVLEIMDISDKVEQIYMVHFLLLLFQVVVIYYLVMSFKKLDMEVSKYIL